MSKAENRAETDRLVAEYLARGGVITVCPTGRRTANTNPWHGPHARGAVAHRGRKTITLRNMGNAKSTAVRGK